LEQPGFPRAAFSPGRGSSQRLKDILGLKAKIGAASVLLVSCTVACAIAHAENQASTGADLILLNGRFVTVNEGFRIAEAVAIRDGRFIAVGADNQVASKGDSGTQTLDLQGRTVIPGIVDGHNHLLLGGLNARGVDLSMVRSLDELLSKLKERIAVTPKGRPVVSSSSWHESQLKRGRLPTRRDLDAISPHHPVVLLRGALQVVMNSSALRTAGISKDTPDPVGGKIIRDPDTGEPTGEIISFGRRAVTLEPVQTVLPPPTREAKLTAIRRGMKELNRVGITSIRDPAVTPQNMKLYEELRDAGELTLRISMLLFPPSHAPLEVIQKSIDAWGVTSGFGDEMLRLDAVKLVMDGGFEGGLMSEPYVGRPDFFGIQAIPSEKFNFLVSYLNRQDWRVSVHCVGDRAIDLALDGYERANRNNSVLDKRWTIEHAILLRPHQLERIKSLGVAISAQHHTFVASSSMTKYWGTKRAAATMPVRMMLDAGLLVGGGTDWPVGPSNPFLAMSFWVTRDTRFGGTVGAEHSITREEALRLLTVNAAHLTFEEKIKGSIEVGKLADLAILSDDYLSVPESKIRDIEVIATMLDGKWVYKRGDLLH